MRLSRATSYALHALSFLARCREKGPISTRTIAADTGISVVFLLKALKPCVDRQLLISVTGPHGGYRLARPASAITVLEVVEAIEGPMAAVSSYQGKKSTAAVDRAIARLLKDATQKVREIYNRTTIAQLAGVRSRR